MSLPLEEIVEFAQCRECGGDVKLTVWGEGIDSSIECVDCEEQEIYR